MTIATPTLADLTSATLAGNGIFDVLMRANKAHLDEQYDKGRIKGTEYATVYLGSLQQVLNTSVQFLLAKDRTGLDAQLVEQQILLAQVEVSKATAELAIVEANLAKVPLELAQLTAQTAQVTQQTSNLVAEALNIPKQGTVLTNQAAQIAQQTANLVSEELGIDAKTAQISQQTANLTAEALNIPKQGLQIEAQTALSGQQKTNLVAEELNISKQGTVLTNQGLQIAQQTLNLVSEELLTDAKTAQTTQQTTNLTAEKLGIEAKTLLVDEQAKTEQARNFINPLDPTKSGSIEQERRVLIAQECKLKGEFDNLQSNLMKTAQETQLLTWKVTTEKSQTSAIGVDDNSVVGKQKLLYAAQTGGFVRDAEQKAAKIMVDSWNVRRTTDETGTQGNTTNTLDDAAVGRAVTRLLSGVGA
jgi:hypothetical protein